MKFSNSKILVAVVSIIIIISGLYIVGNYSVRTSTQNITVTPRVTTDTAIYPVASKSQKLSTYVNSDFGITFDYPSTDRIEVAKTGRPPSLMITALSVSDATRSDITFDLSCYPTADESEGDYFPGPDNYGPTISTTTIIVGGVQTVEYFVRPSDTQIYVPIYLNEIASERNRCLIEIELPNNDVGKGILSSITFPNGIGYVMDRILKDADVYWKTNKVTPILSPLQTIHNWLTE